jgi:hypothetical protein
VLLFELVRRQLRRHRHPMPPNFPARAAPNAPPSDQYTTTDFWQNPNLTAASGSGFGGPCHDFPATKRRKLNENHSSIPREAYIPQQQQQSWPQQTYLPPQHCNLNHQSQGYLTPQNWGHNHQPRSYLSQQDYDLEDQYQNCRPPQNWNVGQQYQAPLQQQYWEPNGQYQSETLRRIGNATDARGWDLARLHTGLQASRHADYEQPSQVTSYQTPPSQNRIVPQKILQTSSQGVDYGGSQAKQGVIQKISYGYNSWNETQYQKALQIEPGKEIESAKVIGLEVSVLEYGVRCPPQSTVKHQCSPHRIIKSPESQTPGQRFDLQEESPKSTTQSQESQSPTQRNVLQQESPKSMIQNQDAEESGRPVTTAAAEVCYGMVSPESLRTSHALTPI